MLYNFVSFYKFKKIVAFYLVCSTLLFTACQPTPANEAVINKSNSNLEDRVLDTPDIGEEWLKSSERVVWEESKNVSTVIGECNITVSMDADMPDYPGPVPVYMIEPTEFSLEFYTSLVGYLMPQEIYDGRPSKQDVTLETLNAKKQISEHTISDENKSNIDDYYNYLDEKYNNASESNNAAIIEFIENEQGQSAVRVKSYLDDSTIMTLTGKSSSFYFKVNEFNTVYYYSSKESHENLQASGIETTYEQALEKANNAIERLFGKTYSMVHVSIADMKNDLEYLWSDEETSLGQAYVFYYTPSYDGFPSLYIDSTARTQTDNTEYAKPYVRECALIVVNDKGIVYMAYSSISDIVKKLNDNVKLMPFEEVLERFKEDVFHHNLWGKSADIEVTQIKFGMVREPVIDNPDQYMMIPAWNFIGNIKSAIAEEKEKSILALNAIDGSIIADYDEVTDPK